MPEPAIAPVPDPPAEPVQLERGERERPPSRRGCETISFKIGQRRVHLTIGRYPDDRICEIFIASGKYGSDMRALFEAFAITASLYFQTGGCVADLASKWRRTSFEPSGPVSGPEELGVTHASSIIDAIAQYLEHYASE